MTETILKLLETKTEMLADVRQVRVIASTSSVDRMGDIVVQEGIDLSAIKASPTVLWGHNPDKPVATLARDGSGVPIIAVVGGKLRATVQFPADGEDEDADWVYGKIKAGIVNSVSIGFIPKEYEPIDAKEPWGGFKFKTSELLEFSFCSVPANKDCVIVGRSLFASAKDALPSETKAPMMDPADCPSGDCPMKKSVSQDALMSKARLDRIMGLPAKLRIMAEGIPDKAKGARGQLLRTANIVEREIAADHKENEEVVEPIVVEEAVPPQPPVIEETKDAELLAVQRLAVARMRFDLERSRI